MPMNGTQFPALAFALPLLRDMFCGTLSFARESSVKTFPILLLALLVPLGIACERDTSSRASKTTSSANSSPAAAPATPISGGSTSTVLTSSTPASSAPAASSLTSAQDWPLSRGNPQRTGEAADWTAQPPFRVAWSLETKESIEAEAIVVEGVVYAGTARGTLYALDLATHAEKWKIQLEGGLNAAPCLAAGRLYVVDDGGKLLCLDPANGKEIWHYATKSECHSSPVCDGNAAQTPRVLFGSYDQSLHCLDARAGRFLWKHETGGPVHCAPAVFENHSFTAGCDSRLRCVDLTSGTLAWSLEMPSYAAATPALRDGCLYVGHFGGQVIAVDLKQKKELWRYPTAAVEFPFYASCAVTADYVIAGGRDKKVHAIHRQTGEKAWIFQTKGDIDAAPCVGGGCVFVASKDGTLYVLDLKTGAEKWKYVAGAPFIASPALAQGRIVIGDAEGTLFCFAPKMKNGEEGEKDSPQRRRDTEK